MDKLLSMFWGCPACHFERRRAFRRREKSRSGLYDTTNQGGTRWRERRPRRTVAVKPLSIVGYQLLAVFGADLNKELIQLRINGQAHKLEVAPNRLLLDVLRADLGLTGTKCGCDDSSCGACTVLVNGQPQISCLMLAVSYQDAEITTIEGVARSGERNSELDPIQCGFMLEGGAQCGFCTPGMILTAKHLLAANPNPSDPEIADALSGNLCRCTGYMQIYASVRKAVELMRGLRAEALPAGPAVASPVSGHNQT
jgi:aerobic carbon-monoxide dehydrogenase small subunit